MQLRQMMKLPRKLPGQQLKLPIPIRRPHPLTLEIHLSPTSPEPRISHRKTNMAPAAKRAKTAKDTPYDLLYWPGIPGRGEHIRLVLEEAGASYTDTASTGDVNSVLTQISQKNTGDASNTPHFAPPILKHGDLIISQLPNILQYLGQRHGLAPRLDGEDASDGAYVINQLALTILDGLSNEAHDTHHPVAVGLTYEDQQPESLRRAEDYRKNRLPKYLGYFERVLAGEASGDGPWLHGGQLTYADIVLFQVSA
jgi:glutathione S-transferase